jgi:hypothetical protein
MRMKGAATYTSLCRNDNEDYRVVRATVNRKSPPGAGAPAPRPIPLPAHKLALVSAGSGSGGRALCTPMK